MLDFLNDFTWFQDLDIPDEFWLIATAVLGLVLLFAGRKIIRFWLALAGLAGGSYVGTLIVEQANLEAPTSWIVIVLLALAGASLLALAYKACFFIGGFIGGIFLANYVLDIFWPGYPEVMVIAFAVVVGLVAVFLEKEFTIGATAITGAMLTADSVVSLVYKTDPGDLLKRVQVADLTLTDDLIILLSIAILATVGIMIQRKQKQRR